MMNIEIINQCIMRTCELFIKKKTHHEEKEERIPEDRRDH